MSSYEIRMLNSRSHGFLLPAGLKLLTQHTIIDIDVDIDMDPNHLFSCLLPNTSHNSGTALVIT